MMIIINIRGTRSKLWIVFKVKKQIIPKMGFNYNNSSNCSQLKKVKIKIYKKESKMLILQTIVYLINKIIDL